MGPELQSERRADKYSDHVHVRVCADDMVVGHSAYSADGSRTLTHQLSQAAALLSVCGINEVSAGDQFPLPPSVASFTIDHPP
jgi:hypothetical protein